MVIKYKNTATIAILYSEKVAVTASCDAVKKAIDSIETKQFKKPEIKFVCADTLQKNDLQDVKVLINTLGAFYPESGWEHIHNYFCNKGIILNIGAKPFSIPYLTRDGKVKLLQETLEACNSLVVINEHVSTGPCGKNETLKILNPRYKFINDLYKQCKFPVMSETGSINYQFAEKVIPKPNDTYMDETYRIDSQLETICGWFDESNRLIAVPISRVDHFDKGSLIFMNFTPEEANFYSSDSGIMLLSGMIATALEERVHLTLTNEYARYYEYETPKVDIRINSLDFCFGFTSTYDIKLELSDIHSGKLIKVCAINNISAVKAEYCDSVKFDDLSEGFYKLTACLYINNILICEKSTGFYKLSQKLMQNEFDKFKPISIDTSKSPDFCLQDGKPFAMHGTTYFVTDVYRNCFIDFNAYICDMELSEIRSIGFNLLRSGNWYNALTFFDADGNICEKSLRALEAFFLTAVRYDLVVQFVLAAFIFNPWDRTKCPIHNPEIRNKTITVFDCFAKRFKNFNNVQVDAMNEPSYSYNGVWSNARPSGDPYEKINWINWLKKKYGNDITLLREIWGVGSNKIITFDDIDVPSNDQFSRDYDRKQHISVNHTMLNDFFVFARESFSSWTSDIRNEIKKKAPDTMFMMGRDESLRIPAQQDEALNGNYDMINWHQWHHDSIVFVEYILSKVRGLPCCGQEQGVYHISDPRGLSRLSEADCAKLLERKLCYSFGNWVQWQFHCDPYIIYPCELELGLVRVDKTEKPQMNFMRLLTWIEGKTSEFMMGRNENTVEILTVHPSKLFFSADNKLAQRGAYKSIMTLHYNLKMQSDMVLEHNFVRTNVSQIGDPKLIIFPAALMVSDSAWELLLEFMEEGKCVLLSGYADIDEYFSNKERFKKLGIDSKLSNICCVETISIDNKKFSAAFRENVELFNPATAFSKVEFPNEPGNFVRIFNVGKGKLIHCPVPLELGDSFEPIEALYSYAMKVAGVSNKIFSTDDFEAKQNLLVYPIQYTDCTLYTIVNEGGDDSIKITDIISGVEVEVYIKAQRASKLWLNKEGKLIGAYLNDKLKIGDKEIVPNGDLSIFKNSNGWNYMAGIREEQYIVVEGLQIAVKKFEIVG